MPITRKGWELHVERLAVHKKGSLKRTFGRYTVYIKGVAQPDLTGFVCEAQGPGDNTKTGKNKRRVEAGRYQISTQFGKYRSTGYATDGQVAGKIPMPGFRLEDRGVRTDILVHPGHPPTPYLSSIGCLNPTGQLEPDEVMNFWDSRGRVIDLLDSLKAFAPSAFEDEVITEIAGAFVVIDGEPMEEALAVPMAAAGAQAESAMVAMAMPTTLPISEAAARKCATWLWRNFKSELRTAVAGKPYGVEHLAAIVCQETAYKWVPWIGTQSVKTIVERAVYDASGDDPSSPRNVFPVDTADFRGRFGKPFTDMLIAEANATRALQGWSPKKWVYKGYGLFQYDLQEVRTDRAFFEQKQWYDFATTVGRCTRELDGKLALTHGDLWKAIRAYNGAGPAAQSYMENVRYYTPICAEIMGTAQTESTRAPKTRGRKPTGTARKARAPALAVSDSREPSGPEWVARFPDGGRIEELEPDFRAGCGAFIGALRKAGASVEIHSTRRPKERAYLMNGAWRIARDGDDPGDVRPFPGVDIEWVHRKANGSVDLAASRRAARAMVDLYGLAFKPALTSNHILGKAIDMTIAWRGTLTVANAKGEPIAVSGAPRSGMNEDLWPVGRSYGVRKLAADRPHWSANGR